MIVSPLLNVQFQLFGFIRLHSESISKKQKTCQSNYPTRRTSIGNERREELAETGFLWIGVAFVSKMEYHAGIEMRPLFPCSAVYAIAFDLTISDLKTNYGDPYNNAYAEIQKELQTFQFGNTQGSVYLYQGSENGLAVVYQAINRLSQIDWFRKSVRGIRVFKVEDWSDFTAIVKGTG
jgi:virulence-associated protein VapD